ncbi:MAG: histidinol-phosphatase HisJ family protein [Eubacteriales bacterium]|nr:histidinol-phosphatase HisJ family protein [Eubacteriales bacterium]
MPIRADYHMHSSFSGDSQAPMEDMIRQAICLGLSEICFTEHMDMDFPVSEECPAGMFELDADAYRAALLCLREQYRDRIKVRFGVELGLQPDISRRIAAFAAAYDFDFIIGSTHVVRHLDPAYPSYYEGRTTEEGYRAYFEEILASVRSFSDFDVYGHIDYVIRYSRERDANYRYEQYADIFGQIIDALLEKGKGIEINTAGLRKGLREQHPCTGFLKEYRRRGGEIVTVGSDAHRPADIALPFARAEAVLKECGFTHYCTFEKRRPLFHRL